MLVNSGQVDQARTTCLKACNSSPGDAELWFILSAICGQMKDYPAAEKYSKKVIKLNSAVPAAHYNLAVALRGQGKRNKAIDALKKALSLQADFPAAIFEMANIMLESGDYQQAISDYSKVVSQTPDAFQAYTGMAKAYASLNEYEKAVESFQKSLNIKPDQDDVCNSLASLYDRSNKVELAIRYYEGAVKYGCQEADAFINLGRMYALQGAHGEAQKQYNRALEIDASSTEAYTGLALLNEQLNRLDDALEFISKALSLSPDDPHTLYNYAKILDSRRQYTKAAEYYNKAIAAEPDLVEAYINLGNIYLLSGSADEACDMYSMAYKICPERKDVASNMLLSMNYTETRSRQEVYESHADWGRTLAALDNKPDVVLSDNKVIKVGYVSPDFRQHSVAYFFESILRNSSANMVSNYCYSDVKNKDEVTARFEEDADYWRDVADLDNEALAKLIRDDNIDILVDLCGHIAGNRLLVFALRPAPIQVTYLGYPNTSGLEAVDYRLVDEHTDPVGSESFMTEEPLYLSPGFLCYTPAADTPDVAALPALDNAFITFGSFNNLAKITSDVIDVWTDVLHKIPDSKLCIKARQFEDDVIRKHYIDMFNKRDISSDRLVLVNYSRSVSDHLGLYGNIDIALDTFPYNGTTTTCEALWMGVPVVTMTGDCHASRVGLSILNVTGQSELVANSKEEYVEIAHRLASDLLALSVRRNEMRDRLESSSLLDGPGFVQALENSYKTMIDRHQQ